MKRKVLERKYMNILKENKSQFISYETFRIIMKYADVEFSDAQIEFIIVKLFEQSHNIY